MQDVFFCYGSVSMDWLLERRIKASSSSMKQRRGTKGRECQCPRSSRNPNSEPASGNLSRLVHPLLADPWIVQQVESTQDDSTSLILYDKVSISPLPVHASYFPRPSDSHLLLCSFSFLLLCFCSPVDILWVLSSLHQTFEGRPSERAPFMHLYSESALRLRHLHPIHTSSSNHSLL